LFDRCKNLQTLVITTVFTCNTRTGALLDYAVRNCRMLCQITISSKTTISDSISEDDDIFSLALFRTLEEHGLNIKELDFQNCGIKKSHLIEMPTDMC
jgi:hypothetical protein